MTLGARSRQPGIRTLVRGERAATGLVWACAAGV